MHRWSRTPQVSCDVTCARRDAPLIRFHHHYHPTTMPVYRECLVYYILLLWWFNLFKRLLTSLKLVSLSGRMRLRKKLLAFLWLRMAMFTVWTRLQLSPAARTGRKPLWPPMWRKKSEETDPPSIQTLELKGVSTTSRAIILDMGPLSLKVCCGFFAF
jgi:hypothetical protein